MFTWIPLYRQIARKLLEFEARQGELTSLLRELAGRGLQVGALEDVDSDENRFPLAEIDPFTFFATFNWQGHKPENRVAILAALREAWQLAAELPTDFDGIPLGNRQNLWLFSYQKQRDANDIPRLWQLARQVIEGSRSSVDRALFTRALGQRNVGEVNLTVGMFWLNPREFLPADKWTRGYMGRRGVPGEVWNGDAYFHWLDACVEKAGTDFPELSLAAFVEKQPPLGKSKTEEPPLNEEPVYWLLQAGRGGSAWEDFRATNDVAVDFSGMEDFRSFPDKAAVLQRILELWPEQAGGKGFRPNATLAAWQFGREMKPGDIVFVYAGFHQMHAIARVTGEYRFVESAPAYRHRRAVEWIAVGPWSMPDELRSPMKTLTRADQPALNRARLAFAKVDVGGTGGAPRTAEAFTRADALAGLFMDATQLETILARLTRKKGIILQGPPGVGKTFVARRLAYALMEERDRARVCMVQFHPSYGYEDFIQGYRPDGAGLRLRNGIFYDFVQRACEDERPHFFIIDEINRGNLAKIFGELLMLLEADKRGPEFALPLTYSESTDEPFWLPKNLYVIGTMNTADRSLAMVDYALRRRFAFVSLEPALHRPEFQAWLAALGAPPATAERIATRVTRLNGVIAAERDLGAGFRIGHSYFCPASAPGDWEAWYREIIEAEIAPLLEEYFDKPARVLELRDALLSA